MVLPFISRDVDEIGAADGTRSEASSAILGRLCLDFVVSPRNRQVSGRLFPPRHVHGPAAAYARTGLDELHWVLTPQQNPR